jgi:hypothetical protein
VRSKARSPVEDAGVAVLSCCTSRRCGFNSANLGSRGDAPCPDHSASAWILSLPLGRRRARRASDTIAPTPRQKLRGGRLTSASGPPQSRSSRSTGSVRLCCAGDEWASLAASRRRSLLGALVESALNRPTNLLRPERFPDRRGRLVLRATIPSPADPGLRADPVLGQRAPPQPPAQLDDRSGPVADLRRGGRPRPRTPGPRNRPRGWPIRHFS